MENILSVDLSSVTSPVVREVRGKDWVEYGTEEWLNLYPQFLIDLYYNSSTHAAIINGTAEMIAGEDIIIDDACHSPSAQIETYKNSKHLLKDGGIYIIEDLARPHDWSTKEIKDVIPEIEFIPIEYKNELLGLIKNG